MSLYLITARLNFP